MQKKSVSQQAEFKLAAHQQTVEDSLKTLREQDVISRIWVHDHTVWKPQPTEISNRLGWLKSPETMAGQLPEIDAFVENVRAEGFTHVLLLGMGGSSLAPEVFRLTFGAKAGYLDLAVLDSTDPGAVLACDRALNLAKTLIVVSTKSGGTIETLSAFKYFYNRTAAVVGDNHVGSHFVAITDPGSGLEALAQELNFRQIFLNNAKIGGRFSVLSFFGLVPAALVGVDVQELLARTAQMAQECMSAPNDLHTNPGASLGAVMGALAKAGRDKVTLISSPQIASFGAWVEQLVAESTGKEGVGILPVATEPPGAPDVYADDRVFVYLQMQGDVSHDDQIAALEQAGFPIIRYQLDDRLDLGKEFFKWEIATAVACYFLGINPFDQPNVESAKAQAKKMMAAYQESGELPKMTASAHDGRITIYSDFGGKTAAEAVQNFLQLARSSQDGPRPYVSLQAYLPTTPATEDALNLLASTIRDRFQIAVTYGYGPRFLHSTGQLHKGDAGNGLFIQLTADMPENISIPEKAGTVASSISFAVLKMAQALGDRQALLDNNRRVLCLDLGSDIVGGLEHLTQVAQ